MARVMVGLSGGVDSSVAAALLQEQGHEVVAGYMKNWLNEDGIAGDCPWEQDIEDAHAVAKHLGIEFRVVDLIDHYRERIVDYLLKGYQEGITPNPDVFCNREMKFGVFLDYALSQGFEAVGTGHYARRRVLGNGSAAILRGADTNKDQSYFLAMMRPEQVLRARFPVGELLKTQVRAEARRFGLPTAEKKDSQGICFIGNIKMGDFLQHHVPDEPGEIVDLAGQVLGQHRGLHFYTLGQRKGHGIASPREGQAYVVVRKDANCKQLVVAYEDDPASGLYSREAVVGSLSWLHGPREGDLEAQPRYRAKSERVHLIPEPGGEGERMRVSFRRDQRAITPGQICAFYEGGQLLGAGVFESHGSSEHA